MTDQTIKNIYVDNGYKNRRDYLESLADDYGLPFSVVHHTAEFFGPNEDFDGLVSTLDVISMSDEYL